VPRDRISLVGGAVERVAATYAPVDVRVDPPARLGGRAARVLAIGITAPDDGLGRLHDALEAALEQVGFRPDGRRFRAHLTLARPRGRAGVIDRDAIAAVASSTAEVGWRADAIVLFESELTGLGARHHPIVVAPLAGDPGSSDADGTIGEASGQRPTAPVRGSSSTCRSPRGPASSPPSDSST
jgi:2'-5' RNA ligase